MNTKHLRLLPALLLAFLASSGCDLKPFGKSDKPGPNDQAALNEDNAPPARLQAVRFIDPVRPASVNPPVLIAGARNETVQFAIQINDAPENPGRKEYALKLTAIAQSGGSGAIPLANVSASQVLPLPIDANRAGFVRYTGLNVEQSLLPRALVPLDLLDGAVELASLKPTGSAPIVWFDVQIPPTIPPGDYECQCELIERGRVSFSAPVKFHVEDFVLPDERHLVLAGAVTWQSLQQYWPDRFGGYPVRLLSRTEPRHAPAVKLLDDMVRIAHAHRADLFVPELQPTVKWLTGKPIFDWTDFDSIVSGWLKGSAFPDGVPAGYWALPVIDKLDEYSPEQQKLYWAEVASHFDQLDWLMRASAPIQRRSIGRVGLEESFALSAAASDMLAAHPRMRVSAPLEEEQVRLVGPDAAGRIRPDTLERLLITSDGLVSTAALQRLPANTPRWLRTDVPGLVPGVASGADERQTRLYAWLAFVRRASLVQWNSVLPSQGAANIPADPDEAVWFYPGEWFGVTQPVPSIQLKWLRRAQQDFEYLWLAQQRGQAQRAQAIAQLLVKPVQLQPGQAPDAVYGLVSGSANPKAWDDAVRLLSRAIQLAKPGGQTDRNAENQLTYDLVAWTQAQARPILLPRSAEWYPAPSGIKHTVGLKLGIDIYNPAPLHPEPNSLQWNGAPDSWAVSPVPVEVPRTAAYSVSRFEIDAAVDLDALLPGKTVPARLLFTEGYSKQSYNMSVLLPVAYSERRNGAAPRLDGSLDDWMAEDTLFKGPMVKLIDRPALHAQRLDYSSSTSWICSTWMPTGIYMGFRLEGADAPITNVERSFVERQFGRAWGEDIAEVVAQPIYSHGAGPLFHLTFKPRGQLEVWRRLDPRLNVNPWQAFGSTEVRYAANVTEGIWRGEVMIPWEVLAQPGKPAERPLFLKLNFLQHRGRNGESASWAGPIDLIRDDPLMGLVQIRPEGSRSFVPGK